MSLNFYPHADDISTGSLSQRIDLLAEAAERYKAYVLDDAHIAKLAAEGRNLSPRDLVVAFNWDEIASVLREIRDSPEISKPDKLKKGALLNKLADIYTILRSAKMSKLEAVRLALTNEANQLSSDSAGV